MCRRFKRIRHASESRRIINGGGCAYSMPHSWGYWGGDVPLRWFGHKSLKGVDELSNIIMYKTSTIIVVHTQYPEDALPPTFTATKSMMHRWKRENMPADIDLKACGHRLYKDRNLFFTRIILCATDDNLEVMYHAIPTSTWDAYHLIWQHFLVLKYDVSCWPL